ncbi:M3 family metallopeptidase, partial [Lysobacter sp. 2RAB21]
IKDSDFAPAFDRGMADQIKEIEAIANNADAPSFDNTILAMERSGQILSRAGATFFNLTGTDTNPTRENLQQEYAPKLAAHRDAISLNPKLFARIKSLYDQRDKLGLDAEGVRLVERYYSDFVRSGANLNDAQKTRLKAINAELAELGAKFSKNVLAEVKESAIVVDTKEELAGLSEERIAAAAEAAKGRKLEGKYLLTLLNTTGQPPETDLTNRALREKLHKASIVRGSRGNQYDNTAIVSKVVTLRAERAKMMGYPNYAAYVLEDETAKNPE